MAGGWHKYSAVKVKIDGVTFASKAEGKRYTELKSMQQQGLIKDLKLQPKFPCVVNGVKICTWIADFKYIKDGDEIIEDIKGVRLPIFNLKLKLVKALYPEANILLLTQK